MATEPQRQRLRRDVGYLTTDTTSLPDSEVDALFVEAEELFTDAASIVAATRIYYLQGLLASSAKLASYKQNQTTENISDIFEHVKDLLAYWKSALGEAILTSEPGADGVVRAGRPTQRPRRMKEYPDS